MQSYGRARQGFGRNNHFSNSNPNGRPFYGRPQNSRRGRGEEEKIDISRFIKKSSPIVEEKSVKITHSFADFGFSREVTYNLKRKNYNIPTPIQDQAIKPIMEGRDVIGLANTGTGKTAAFLLPLINKIASNRSQRVLIIAPTRELAMQIESEFREFSFSMRLFSALCVGGMPIYKQISNLRKSPNFVIGTPGRLKDLSKRGLIQFGTFQNIVIDEIDRMLDMGFIDEIKGFLSQLPSVRQSLFFSATIPAKIKDLVGQFLVNPITIATKSGETASNVDQDIIRVAHKGAKLGQLHDLLIQPGLDKVLIFSETKADVEKLTNDLVERGFKAESIHGNKRQNQRQKALTLFKNNIVKILVATDVAARGLDIKDITHVINYTIPQTYDNYVHRIGRTGRGDSKGKALTFVVAR